MRKLAVGFWVVGLVFAAQAVDLPTMGWSSWNTYRVNISEELIKRQADALVNGGFAAVGYKYVNIDDGWFGGRDKDGRHTTNPKRFPNGLKPVVDYIHAKGLKAGAYSDAGENTCGSIWDNDVLGIGVGFYGHDEEDARWFFDEMDFDFIKIDFGGGTPQGNKAHVVMNEKERYTAIARAIAKTKKGAAGKVRMNVCCWRYPGSWVSEIAGSWRISGDVAATWESVKGIIDKNSYFARFQKPGHYNDMDMLEVGRGLTEEEDKTHFGMWCMMASPLLIGCDLTTIKPEAAKLLKNTDLIAIDQDLLGLQAEVVWRDWKYDIRVYAKPLAPAGSMNKAIALYNGTDDERTITAELDALGYDWSKVSVWDCFEHRAVTNACRTFSVKVPPHGTRIYRLSAGHDILAAGWIDFNKNGVKDVYEDPTQPVERRVADLLSQMTIKEKTCQLATLYGSGRVLKDAQPTDGWTNEVWKDGIANIDEELNGVGPCARQWPEMIYPFSNHVAAVNAIQRWFVEKTRLGIPVDFSNEGIHGLNHTKATPLPAPIGIGSTWNRALVREAGEIVGHEAKLIGYSNVYAPILDVARDPRWGRTLECYGEDPYLVGALGVEMVRGIQSQGVASTLKHYAVYSVPKGGRDADCRTDPHVTPRELHEIFLAPFRRVIREAHPLGVMCSYNDWNGEPVAASRYFLTDLLRGKYGFDGYVVSDSEAVEFVHTKHAVAETYAEACAQVLEAGLNVRTHFTTPKDFILPVREMIASGRLPMSVIDRRVAEVLSVKFRLGLFDNPYLGAAARADAEAGLVHHRDFADRIQAESLVLLKNDGILPLDRTKTKKILVTGPLAAETNYLTSRYGPNGNPVVSVLDGLRDCLKGRAEVVYEKGCETVDVGWPDSEIVHRPLTEKESAAMDAAVELAADVDLIVAVLGEDEKSCGESRSRTSLDLPGRQQQLLERLQATGKTVVLVLVNGQPLTVNWADRNVAAILEAWFPGPRGGMQIAKTLFGELNPSGRLTVTFPKAVGQIEYNFPFKKGSHGKQNSAGDPNGSGVTRVIGSLYPFGHGLSYTEYAYSNLVVVAGGIGSNAVWTISCDVTNTGGRDGAEVVQLYVRDLYSTVVTYDSVLRGFEKVHLRVGEKKRISFVLSWDDLAILNRNMKWMAEPGEFELCIGASSEDIRLRRTMRLLSSYAFSGE